jgi:hypothetical protein
MLIFGETLSLIYGCLQLTIIYRKITDRSDIDKLQDRNTLDEWAVENEIKINPGKIKQ